MGVTGKQLSVIIPVYKVRDYVGQCLQSIFDGGCDESEYEVIVVNDGTPDDSMAVVREICKGRENVIVIEQENQGLSAARMAGLAHASGEYVWFVDSDDWLGKGAVATIVEILSSKPGYSVYTMPLLWTSQEYCRADYTLDREQAFTGRELLRSPYPLWAIQRHVIQREILDNETIFFPKGLLHEDEYYYRALLYQAPKVFLMKDSLYYYRQRADSIMGTKSVRSCDDIVSVYRLLRTFLEKMVRKEDYKWFQQDIVSLLLRCYKDSFTLAGPGGPDFRKRTRALIFSESLRCKGFTLKEKMWVMHLLLKK